MEKEFEAQTRFSDDIATMDLKGEINIFAEEKLTHLHRDITEKGIKKILLNFKDVNYINSAGIAIIIGMVSESQEQGQQLVVVNLIPHFQRIFEMVGLTQYVTLSDSEDEAVASFSQQP